MGKLTLSVDAAVVARAKQFAAVQGKSLSALVERYLAEVSSSPSPEPGGAPVLRRLRGVLRKGSLEDYRAHRVKKHL